MEREDMEPGLGKKLRTLSRPSTSCHLGIAGVGTHQFYFVDVGGIFVCSNKSPQKDFAGIKAAKYQGMSVVVS